MTKRAFQSKYEEQNAKWSDPEEFVEIREIPSKRPFDSTTYNSNRSPINGIMDPSNLFIGTFYHTISKDDTKKKKFLQLYYKCQKNQLSSRRSNEVSKSQNRGSVVCDVDHIFDILQQCGFELKTKSQVPIDLRSVGELLAESIYVNNRDSSATLCDGVHSQNPKTISFMNVSQISNSVLIHVSNLDEECLDLFDSIMMTSQDDGSGECGWLAVSAVCPATMSVEQAVLMHPVTMFGCSNSTSRKDARPNKSSKNGSSSYCNSVMRLSVMREKVEDLHWLANIIELEQDCGTNSKQKVAQTMSHQTNGRGDNLPPASHYLLSTKAMRHLEYPDQNDVMSAAGYIEIPSVSRHELTADSPLLAIDCEMCLVRNRYSQESALTRVAITDENYNTLYDTLVKPKNRIYDYLTRFSGITEEMLLNVKTSLSDVQRDLLKIIPKDAILVGHSLNFDLHALKVLYPHVIDTSQVLKKPQWPPARLKHLIKALLEEKIQLGDKRGHHPVEDANAAMKLAQMKIQHGPDFYFRNSVGISLENVDYKSIFSLIHDIRIESNISSIDSCNGVIMDRPHKKESYSQFMKNSSSAPYFHPIICDHEIKTELFKMIASRNQNNNSSSNVPYVAVLRGIEDLIKLGDCVESDRLKRRVEKSVSIVKKIKNILPPFSFLTVIVSSKINSVNAQQCKVYFNIKQ